MLLTEDQFQKLLERRDGTAGAAADLLAHPKRPFARVAADRNVSRQHVYRALIAVGSNLGRRGARKDLAESEKAASSVAEHAARGVDTPPVGNVA